MSTPEVWVVLQELIQKGDQKQLAEYVDQIGSGEMGRSISRLSEEERSTLFHLLDPEQAADVMEDLPEEQAADYIEDLSGHKAAEIVEELDSDEKADILGAMDVQDAENILQRMDPEEARETRQLLSYDPDTAGGMMITEFIAFPEHFTISEVLSDLERNSEIYAEYEILYGYVVDASGLLKGVIKFRDLLLKPRSTKVTDIMVDSPVTVETTMKLDQLEEIFDKYEFFAVPVVTSMGSMVGLLLRSDIREAVGRRAEQTFLASKGILGGEELRTMPLRSRSMRRLAILFVSVGTNMISASVIAANQETLQAAITLAVFMPMISDLSGCSGNQAIAVSIRELALGLTKPRDIWRVLSKELQVGLMNGLILGLMLATIVGIWKSNFVLAGIIGTAMALNSIIAVLLGGSIPLFLKRLGLDPAIASSPMLTTCTDVCGFSLSLGLTKLFLDYLL